MSKRQGSVEITSKMIEAGVSVLLHMGNDYYGIDYAEVAKEIYLEMTSVKEGQTLRTETTEQMVIKVATMVGEWESSDEGAKEFSRRILEEILDDGCSITDAIEIAVSD